MAKTGHVRAEITVYGDVQGVGYRYFARRIAWKHGLTGNIENREDGAVKIVCEGEKKTIDSFVESIDVKRPPIDVENVSSKFSEAAGEFVGFKIFAGSLEEEMIEGFSTGASYFEVMFDKQDQALGKMDQTLDKQDQALGKMDQTLDKQDAMLDKQDDLKSAVEHGFSELKEEHIKTREISMDIFHSEVQELRQEINSLRSSVEEIRKKVGIA